MASMICEVSRRHYGASVSSMLGPRRVFVALPVVLVTILTFVLVGSSIACIAGSPPAPTNIGTIPSGASSGTVETMPPPATPTQDLNSAASTGPVSSSVSIEPTTSFLTLHNPIGWDGNGTIYPTNDTTPYPLPPEGSFAFQTAYNASLGLAGSGGGVANSNLLNVTSAPGEVPEYADLGGVDNIFQIWLYVAAVGGDNPFDYNQDGCNEVQNLYGAYGIQVSVAPSGLPSGGTNEFVTGNNSGYNTTQGNLGDGGSSSSQLLEALSLGLAVAAIFFPEALPISVGAIGAALAAEQPDGPVSNSLVTSYPEVDGNQVASQVVGVNPGTGTVTDGCEQVTGGQNVFSQADWVEELVPGSSLSTLTGGSLTVSSSTILGFFDNTNPSESTVAAGAATSVSYPIAPAASIGGHVRLYTSPSCAPNCPALPNATVSVVQDVGSGPAYQTTNTETTSSAGYWHFFAETGSPVTQTSYSASWSDALGTATSPVYYITPQEGSDNESVDPVVDGGQLFGNVMGYESGTPRGISGATVQLCNNNGCISTISGQGGGYALDYPIAGSSTDPYQVTISRAGWVTTTQKSLLLTVGQPNEKNVYFTPQYNVTFSESNLTAGNSWCVTLGKLPQTCASSPTAVTLTEPNGSYAYTVKCPAGWGASPGTGQVTLSGAGDSITVRFSSVPGLIYFNETGLPSGYRWNVTLGSGGGTSTGSSIEFSAAQGSFRFSIQGPVVHSGVRTYVFEATPGSGTVTLSGSAVTENITFTERADVILGDRGPALGAISPLVLDSSSGLILYSTAATLVPSILWIWRRRGEVSELSDPS